MKSVNSLKPFFLCLIAGLITLSNQVLAQDTLHLYYHHTQMKAHDTTAAKIEKWAKSLNGQKVDIEVHAYYHKSEFKKFAEERANDMFLVMNRKARELITIKSIGAKKGMDWQRSMVDIVYRPAGSVAAPREKEKPVAEKTEKEGNKAKEKPSEKEAVSKVKKEKPEEPKEEKPKKEAVKKVEKTEKEINKETEETVAKQAAAVNPDYEYDTVYVNGVMKVNKKKIKKKK